MRLYDEIGRKYTMCTSMGVKSSQLAYQLGLLHKKYVGMDRLFLYI